MDVAPNSGKLVYRLIDDTGKGLPDVAVSLFAYEGVSPRYEYRVLLDKQLTDINGQIEFGDLIPAGYRILVDSAKINNVSYQIQEIVQVPAAAITHQETKVSDFSGTLSLSVHSYNDEKPMEGVGMILIPLNRIYKDETTPVYLKMADFKGTTDGLGFAKFRIPCYRQYMIHLYNLATHAAYKKHNPDVLFLEKDAEVNHVIRITQ